MARAKAGAVGRGINNMSVNSSPLCARPTLLEGADALELYLTKINCNIDAIKQQAALLQMVLVEMEELARELASCRAPNEYAPNSGTAGGPR